ncbi:MAG: hypothetical protein ACK52I_22885, partial [Pseudomonadota bacterium]
PAATTTCFYASCVVASLTPGTSTLGVVRGAGARRGDFADASLDTSSIAFVLDCHVWSNDKVRVTARNVSLSTVDLPAAALHVQVVKRRVM